MASYPSGATYSVGPTTYTMSSKKPDRNFTVNETFNNASFTSQNGYQRTRAISRRSKRQFQLKYTNISGAYKQAIENFYRARGGDFDSFEFDLAYIGLSGTIQVRFGTDFSVSEVLTTSSIVTSVYSVSFTLTESYT
jgi:hypothetical protein